jgi:DmsE family decaheme c-type cytochrome
MRSVSQRNELAKRSQTETCAQCHLLPRSQMYRNSHHPVRERKMACGSCHNPHGTISDALIIQQTINDNCLSCHADKRGPFLWEHAPVTEDCLNCHSPHGATRTAMLRVSVPRLCQQCHIPMGHPTNSYDPDSRFVLSRSCLNCHVNIHGSNHPSGNDFTR